MMDLVEDFCRRNSIRILSCEPTRRVKWSWKIKLSRGSRILTTYVRMRRDAPKGAAPTLAEMMVALFGRYSGDLDCVMEESKGAVSKFFGDLKVPGVKEKEGSDHGACGTDVVCAGDGGVGGGDRRHEALGPPATRGVL